MPKRYRSEFTPANCYTTDIISLLEASEDKVNGGITDSVTIQVLSEECVWQDYCTVNSQGTHYL